MLSSSFPLAPCFNHQFSSFHLVSHVQVLATPWTAAHQASLSITNSQSLLKLMSIESVMPSNHLILRHPLLLPTSVIPSIRGFSNESAFRMRWPMYWSFSFSISPSNEHPGLISLTLGWLDLRAVQGPRKSLPQHFSHGGVCVSVRLQFVPLFFSCGVCISVLYICANIVLTDIYMEYKKMVLMNLFTEQEYRHRGSS